jgi:hypothetical protein
MKSKQAKKREGQPTRAQTCAIVQWFFDSGAVIPKPLLLQLGLQDVADLQVIVPPMTTSAQPAAFRVPLTFQGKSRLALDTGNLRVMAVKAALNRIKDIERHTELTTQTSYNEEIQIVTDRNALAREALAALRALPQAEEEDYKIIVQVLASRLRPDINEAVEDLPEELQPTEAERTRLARDAAHWVILKQA